MDVDSKPWSWSVSSPVCRPNTVIFVLKCHHHNVFHITITRYSNLTISVAEARKDSILTNSTAVRYCVCRFSDSIVKVKIWNRRFWSRSGLEFLVLIFVLFLSRDVARHGLGGQATPNFWLPPTPPSPNTV